MQISHLIGGKTEASRCGSALTSGRTMTRREAMELLVQYFPHYLISQAPLNHNAYHLLKLEEKDRNIR